MVCLAQAKTSLGNLTTNFANATLPPLGLNGRFFVGLFPANQLVLSQTSLILLQFIFINLSLTNRTNQSLCFSFLHNIQVWHWLSAEVLSTAVPTSECTSLARQLDHQILTLEMWLAHLGDWLLTFWFLDKLVSTYRTWNLNLCAADKCDTSRLKAIFLNKFPYSKIQICWCFHWIMRILVKSHPVRRHFEQ